MKKTDLTRKDHKEFNNENARDIYINSSFVLYQDDKGIYYLDELDHGANIEYSAYGSIEDIEEYIIEVFGE